MVITEDNGWFLTSVDSHGRLKQWDISQAFPRYVERKRVKNNSILTISIQQGNNQKNNYSVSAIEEESIIDSDKENGINGVVEFRFTKTKESFDEDWEHQKKEVNGINTEE